MTSVGLDFAFMAVTTAIGLCSSAFAVAGWGGVGISLIALAGGVLLGAGYEAKRGR